jgi:hypothetical protein
MLHFLNPEEFDDVDEFKVEYGDLKTKEQVDKLQASLRPYMLRYPPLLPYMPCFISASRPAQLLAQRS